MKSNYDKQPFIQVSDATCQSGWNEIINELKGIISSSGNLILTVECYLGVHEEEIIKALSSLNIARIIRQSDYLLSEKEIDAKVLTFNGGDDPVFGVMNQLRITDLIDDAKLNSLQNSLSQNLEGITLIIGSGASKVHKGDILIYADMPRWEGQLRFRRDEVSNLGVSNSELKWSLQYKRAYFTDWRILDRLKREVYTLADYVLDTTIVNKPVMAKGNEVRSALTQATQRPFRVMPFFDPAPWGGQWIKEACDMDRSAQNYGWGFDCVPEENSLLFKFGETIMELPSINLVFQEPQALMGEKVHARFGDEFPIRFDFLDTIDGGNLSFQVHPLTEYIYQHFGMPYTQDESYYYLDAVEEATMYIGLKDGVNPEEMAEDLRSAQRGEIQFPDEKYVNCVPAKKHDHFLLPAGTVHCGGSGGMVLEISATPYIFTFKMWDWGRLGLDGLPRPINVERGLENIAWDRDETYANKHLINCVEEVASGEGWREERTGLHEREFIETRRHWFTTKVNHDTQGGVHVINLVQGREVIVESPTDAFNPFIVHYAETFIIPADVGLYSIRPYGESQDEECATLKAYVRT